MKQLSFADAEYAGKRKQTRSKQWDGLLLIPLLTDREGQGTGTGQGRASLPGDQSDHALVNMAQAASGFGSDCSYEKKIATLVLKEKLKYRKYPIVLPD